MSNVVNLNKFQKSKARIAKRRTADENAVKFGLSKAEKELRKAQSTKADRLLDGQELKK